MVEKMIGSTSSSSNVYEVVDDNSNLYRNMFMDMVRMNQGYIGQCLIIDEKPNIDMTKLFYLLKDSDKPSWDECTNHSKLSVVAYVLTIKSDHRWSEASYDIIVEYARSILLEKNRSKENFYAAKSMMKLLGLGYHKLTFIQTFTCCTTLKMKS
jgi:hypothetical protein